MDKILVSHFDLYYLCDMEIKKLLPGWRDILLLLELWLVAILLSCGYFSIIAQEPMFGDHYKVMDFVRDCSSMIAFIGISLVLNRLFIYLFQPLKHYVGKMFLYSLLLLAVNTLVASLYASIDEISHDEYVASVYVFCLIATFISGVHANIVFQRAYREQMESRHKLEMENARQKEVNLQTSLMALKSQVAPHFLFNNFSILSDLIDESPSDAHAFLDSLSRVYRYKLVNMNTHLVSLHEELQMLRSYVELIKTRFGKAIQVNFPEERSGMVPPLALQLLVENALKHNAHSLKNPLVIDIRLCEDYLLVSNKIQPLSSCIESTGLGLSNLRGRYQLLSKETIEVVDDAQMFTVKIPIL